MDADPVFVDDPEFTELGFRVSKLRVSLKMKKRRSVGPDCVRPAGLTDSPVVSQERPVEASSGGSPNPAFRVPLGSSSPSSSELQTAFRGRLSSQSSVCSTDSGFASPGSRPQSAAARRRFWSPRRDAVVESNTKPHCRPKLGTSALGSCSCCSIVPPPRGHVANHTRAGHLLHKIAHRAASGTSSASDSSKNADKEFAVFYNRQQLMSANGHNISIDEPQSTAANGNRSSRRQRSTSTSSSTDGYTADQSYCSDSIYSTIEELSDPFDPEETPIPNVDSLPPPLPPRRAKLRPPALPPYPSTAVRLVNNIASILC